MAVYGYINVGAKRAYDQVLYWTEEERMKHVTACVYLRPCKGT